MEAKSEFRLRFFDLLFEEQQGNLCLATTSRDPRNKGFAQEFFKWPAQRIDVENWILRNESNRNIYFCINLLSRAERKKDFCLPTKLVWADLDNVNPEEFSQLPPPIVIKSSPGRWQAIWRLTMAVDPTEAEEYSRRIAYLMGADKSGWDLTQLLRVPFTANFKYDPPSLIELERCLEIEARPLLFSSLPPTISAPTTPIPESIGDLTAEHVIYKYWSVLSRGSFLSYYLSEPDEDWSSVLWRVINEGFRAGMTQEEVYVVARESKSNKYVRDNRPAEDLWKDVTKAAIGYEIDVETSVLQIPQMVDGPAYETFVDEYVRWGESVTDAVGEYHRLCMIVALSSIVSNSVRLETSGGSIVPNLWGMLLGDSTLTRKTTAMRLVMDMLMTLDPELIVATDGSPEGLLSALAERPNRASIFFKDELSGFLESMGRREYQAGMQETLTALYDVPPVLSRRLRKETIIIESPSFVFLGGGIPERVFAAIDDSFVHSGFLPRFLVVKGEADVRSRRPLGPPTAENVAEKNKIIMKLADLTELYSGNVVQKIGGEKVMLPKRITAKMTDEAWERNAEFEMKLLHTANDSVVKSLALPTFDRLSRNTLKIGVIFATLRQKPVNDIITVEEDDIINAAWLAQRWGQDSIELFTNAGKGHEEKVVEKVYNIVKDQPGVMRTQLMRTMHWNSREATMYLDTLEERGMIRHEKRGKAAHYWIT